MNVVSAKPFATYVGVIANILIYITAIIIGISYLRRYPIASVLTMAAGAILLITSLASQFLYFLILQQRSSSSMTSPTFNGLLSTAGLVSSFIHVGAISLLLAAIFLNRSRQQSPSNQELR